MSDEPGVLDGEPARSTSERVLTAAEGLFARKGFRATSLRDITELAGVNIAAVNYHFRSKDALLRAVYERSFVPLNAERLRLLQAFEAGAGGGALTIEAVLEALFRPMVEAWVVNPNFILLVGRLQHEPDQRLNGFIDHMYEEVISRFVAAAKRAVPEAGADDLFFWVHFLFGGVVYTLLNSDDLQRLRRGIYVLDAPEVFLKRLIDFGSAGIRALAARPAHAFAAANGVSGAAETRETGEPAPDRQ